MLKQNSEIKDLDVFVENIYRLKFKLFKAVVVLNIEYETHVPDLMTKMRALPGFAVVGQTDKVSRMIGQGARLGLSIKYLPDSEDVYRNVEEMSIQIKALEGVKGVKVVEYNKRPILKNGKPIIY